MAKNIMLMFISLVPIKDRKISKATYEGIGNTYTTNESAICYVLQSLKSEEKLDKIFAFASKRVLNEPVKAEDVPIDELTGKPMTNYQYFKYSLKRLYKNKKFTDNIDSCLTEDNDKEKGSVYHYDEMQLPETIHQRAAWKSMGQIVEMASRIQTYVQKNPNEEVILHVDCTGGLRDAAMMIMGIMRLMQYQNITIGKVLYSNYDRTTERGTVEEVNEIYNLFDLVSGAEEFVRFGSVDVIKSYFENRNKPKSLQNLLDAMNKFAEAIKISRRGEFQEALENLQIAYKNFNSDEKQISVVQDISSLNYNLMLQLKYRIGQEYSFLLQNKSDDYLSIIDWCLDHGYLQQAMTLYTECIPYMLVNKDKMIIFPIENEEKLKEHAKNDVREKEYYLLNVYESKEDNLTARDNFIKILREQLKSKKLDIQKFNKDHWLIKDFTEIDFKECRVLLSELEQIKNKPELLMNWQENASKLPISHILIKSHENEKQEDFLSATKPEQRRKKFFQLIIETKNNSFPNTIKENYPKSYKIHKMIANNFIKLNAHLDNEELLLKITERYFIIKQERNDSAHALMITKGKLSSQESIKKNYSEILKEYMKEGIHEYLEVRKTMQQ